MSDARRSARWERTPPVSEVLSQLKRDGCNLFVSGAVSESTANEATRRLLGSNRLERTRLLVRMPESPAAADLLPAGVRVDDPSVHVFNYCTYSEQRDPLAALSRAVNGAVDEFVSRPVPAVGGELRLAVLSVGALLSRHDASGVTSFLRALTRVVIAARGMGQYRYAGGVHDLAALPLESLFDGFVDLREAAHAEHRVSIPGLTETEYVDL